MATVLVTGGRGFLGNMLAREILARGELEYPGQLPSESPRSGDAGALSPGEPSPASPLRARVRRVVSLDLNATEERHREDHLEQVVGDITDASFMASLFEEHSFDSVFHLAAVLSGQSEKDFDAGMKVNVDATRTLLQCCASAPHCPTLVMTSSVAVFGRPSASGQPADFSEDCPALPCSSYGMEKAVCELLLLDAARRGHARARAVRLPTVVVRPGRPNSATSSFCSSIIREPLQGERATCPVAPDLPLWIQSPQVVVGNILHAHNVALGAASPIITLPGLTTTPREMVQALSDCGGDPALVDWEPDEFLSKVVASWPGSIRTPTAAALGFERDRDVVSIVRQHKDSCARA